MPETLVITIESRLGEPAEVAEALRRLADRIAEDDSVMSVLSYPVSGKLRDSQGSTMGRVEAF